MEETLKLEGVFLLNPKELSYQLINYIEETEDKETLETLLENLEYLKEKKNELFPLNSIFKNSNHSINQEKKYKKLDSFLRNLY